MTWKLLTDNDKVITLISITLRNSKVKKLFGGYLMKEKKEQLKTIYFIGGSPCSGKSTIAEMIAKAYDLYYFKVDDFLEKYMDKGKEEGFAICGKQCEMTAEETWMRMPQLQCEEELTFYREIFNFILEDLVKLESANGIITEGAAYLPELMQKYKIDNEHYVNITPTEEFQWHHYSKRPWISYALEGCEDKEKAFENWMKRDTLFGLYVKEQAEAMGYQTLLTDGSVDSNEVFSTVCKMFGLKQSATRV